MHLPSFGAHIHNDLSFVLFNILCSQLCCNLPRRALDQVDAHFLRNIAPLDLHTPPQLMHTGACYVVCCEPSLEMLPQMFDRVEVWRLRWPSQHLDPVVFEPFARDQRGMLGVVILLEINFAHVQPVISERLEKLAAEDRYVQLRIHTAVDATRVANTSSCHATPKHQVPTSKFDRASNMLCRERATRSFPDPFASVGAQAIDLCFVGENDAFPVVHSQVLVPQNKIEALANMRWQKTWLLLLHGNLHPGAFQSPTHGIDANVYIRGISELLA